MKSSLFFKLLLGFLVFTIIVTVSILIVSFNTIENHYTKTVADGLEKFGRPLLITITPLLENEYYHEIDRLVESIGRETGTRLTIIATDGKVLADSESDPDLMDNHKNRPEIIQALEGKVGSSKRYSATMKERMLYIALPIKSNGKIIGVLRLSRYLKNLKDLIFQLQRNWNDIKFRVNKIHFISREKLKISSFQIIHSVALPD